MSSAKRRTVWASLATTVAATLAALALAPSPSTATTAAIPGVDEVSTSKNMRHLANIPKQAPFNSLDMLNSDLAFQGDVMFAGNYGGFMVYDISKPRRPEIISQVVCPGSQNDISVVGDLLFLSTDSSRSNDSCDNVPQSGQIKESWEGIKIFDVSDVSNPKYVKSVETNCGSHTHTVVPGEGDTVFVYVSSYFPSAQLPDCQPPHDRISIVQVDMSNPESAEVVAQPVLFPDGGNPGDGNEFPEGTTPTSGCHDLTAFPEKDIMAGACMGDGVLFDISDPLAPTTIDSVRDDENFAFWHSATFNNDATKIVFTDELGGGGAATCNPTIGSEKGANGIYDIVGSGDSRELVFRSYFKISRTQSDTENCVAHNGSLIPVEGRDIMVQAWYQGGVQVYDFTDSANPREIGFFERGPISDTESEIGGSWSAYYYNGFIYSNDIQKGMDVLEIRDRLTNPAKKVHFDDLNVQSQESW